MSRSRFVVALSVIVLTAGSSASRARAVVLNFDTPGQYEANFREVLAGDDLGVANQGGNNVLRKGGVLASPSVAIYDTTPADATAKTTFPQGGFKASFDVRFADAGSSVGVYVVDPQDESNGYLADFVINDPNATPRDPDGNAFDWSRSDSQINPLTGRSVTSRGLQSGLGMHRPNVDPGSAIFTRISVTYWTGANGRPQLTLMWGGPSQPYSIHTLEGAPITNPELGLRLFDAVPGNAGGVEIDNLEIVPVPEPTALGVLCAAAGFVIRRPRGRGR